MSAGSFSRPGTPGADIATTGGPVVITAGGARVELSDHLRAVRNHWRIVAISLVISVAAAVGWTAYATPIYASTVTFFVAASTDTGTALQADEFAQRRINSYVGVLTSERLARLLVENHGIDLDPTTLARHISAVAADNTVLLTATVVDSDAERSLEIANAIATEFGPLVTELDNTGAPSSASVSLNVISGPSLDPSPVSPRRTLNLALGVLVGLGAGIALAISRESADRTIRSTDALKDAAQLPVLASITAERQPRRGTTTTVIGSRSTRSEAYRQMRTNLLFSAVGKQMKVVVMTSAVPGEGKSTTAINLALVLAETGKPVLLIDADLRRPMTASYLGVEGAVGLTDVLVGQAEIDDVLQPWGEGGLHVLPAGTLPPNPSELLGSDRMKELMSTLRERFDMIIIDTPPVLPVTDAAVVAAHAHGLVLVVRHGTTTRDQVRTAVEALAAVEAPLTGVALNMVPMESGNEAYSYHQVVPEPPTSKKASKSARAGKAARWTPES